MILRYFLVYIFYIIMNVDQDISLDELSTWKLDSLRSFLCRRGLSTDGSKAELTALCYAAAKMKISVKPSGEDYLKQIEKDYMDLLTLESLILPDPLKLCDGWVDETDGISVWPPVFLSDIANFLMANSDKSTTTKYLNEYKVGKAYEYFSSRWIKEVFYHKISKESMHCFLRAKCTPSQRVNEEDHTVWTCVDKDTGVIRSAYCSCTAGLGQTCNHVAGLLFRLEAANKLGLSTCTSLPCTWDIPCSRSINIEPKLVSEIIIKKSRHGKDHSRPLTSQEREKYRPLKTHADGKKLISRLINVLPNSVLRKGVEISIESEAIAEKKSLVCEESTSLIENLQMCNMPYKQHQI
ncbi:hypothetical protein KUTeg_005373 [Tegillarca granosa]|uniref:SWIM-type domain-containing protein n=1 Tax=Tegillarca granosa TaxID=220873 RepID=A0ABQ9FJK9_TEGGR|nr:hypothetical protein KUTeg_005373 [Tegillarca granosa]